MFYASRGWSALGSSGVGKRVQNGLAGMVGFTRETGEEAFHFLGGVESLTAFGKGGARGAGKAAFSLGSKIMAPALTAYFIYDAYEREGITGAVKETGTQIGITAAFEVA